MFCLGTVDLLQAQNHTAIAQKKVVVESFTGSWCGLCPAGFVTADQIRQQFGDDVIMVSVHISDPMSIEATRQLSETYSGGGVNVFLLDRYLFPDQRFVQFNFTYEPIETKIIEQLGNSSPVNIRFIDYKYDEQQQSIIASLSATFYETLPEADWRFNLWLVEDSVQIEANSYHQANFFHQEPNHPYQGAGNPIPNYIHRHVLRASTGDAWGIAQSLPLQIDSGMTFYYTDTIPLSPYWQPTQLSLIGLVQQYHEATTQRAILNAAQQKLITETITFPEDSTLTGALAANNNTSYFQLQTYPNPSQEQIIISMQLDKPMPFKVYVSDFLGRTVTVLNEEKQPKKQANLVWHHQKEKMEAGIYFIVVELEDERKSQKVIVY